jgi:hypothetical protein
VFLLGRLCGHLSFIALEYVCGSRGREQMGLQSPYEALAMGVSTAVCGARVANVQQYITHHLQ